MASNGYPHQSCRLVVAFKLAVGHSGEVPFADLHSRVRCDATRRRRSWNRAVALYYGLKTSQPVDIVVYIPQEDEKVARQNLLHWLKNFYLENLVRIMSERDFDETEMRGHYRLRFDHYTIEDLHERTEQ